MHCIVADSKDGQNPPEIDEFKNREEVLIGSNHLGCAQEKTTTGSTGSDVNNGDGANIARETLAEVREEETSMHRMPILHLSILLASIWVYLQA